MAAEHGVFPEGSAVLDNCFPEAFFVNSYLQDVISGRPRASWGGFLHTQCTAWGTCVQYTTRYQNQPNPSACTFVH